MVSTDISCSIEAKLVELGWDRKYFPDRFQSYEYYYEWSKLLNQPRELSPRSTLLVSFVCWR